MLQIHKTQMQHLSVPVLDAYKRRLKEHVQDHFALQASVAGDAATARFVDLGVAESMALGFDTEATVQSFVDHMVLLGTDFCRNPLYADIVEPLFDQDIESPVQRHDLLYDRAWAYLDLARGEDAVHLLRAVVAMRTWLSTSGAAGEVAGGNLPGLLEAIYPEKYNQHSPEVIAAFCHECLNRAGADGFQEPQAQGVYAAAAFLAGLGFYRDPLVVGAAPEQVRALETQTDPAARTGLLRAGAGEYLGKILTALSGLTA